MLKKFKKKRDMMISNRLLDIKILSEMLIPYSIFAKSWIN